MRDGARPLLELEDSSKSRNPLIWVALGCAIMFVVAIVLFVVLARSAPGSVDPPQSTPPAQTP